jgi:hypothetical protein
MTGKGSLRISNGTGLDAAVKLVTSIAPRKTVWVIYIRSNEAKTVGKIPPGSYLLRFGLGADWDAAKQRFLLDQEFFQAGDELDFTETEREPSSGERSVEYTAAEVTLHLVPNGNLRRELIDEVTFDEGDSTE